MNLSERLEALVVPEGARDGGGVAPAVPLNLLEIRETNFEARVVMQNFAQIERTLSVQKPSLLNLARMLGLAYFTGTVEANADTVFAHNIGRVPLIVVHSIPLDVGNNSVATLGGARVVGRPEGTPNAARWTATSIAVRATVAGRYAFFLM